MASSRFVAVLANMFTYFFFGVLFFSQPIYSLGASTDTLTWGGDYSRSGYQTGHNMDPAVVGTSNFGQIFKTTLPGNFNGIGPEQVFSQPLVLTGNDGVQYIYIATTQNNIYKLNAKTGVIVFGRNMHVPFLSADLDGCVDIYPTVGVTATGVIDPATGIWYLTSKTYAPAFQNGKFSPTATPGRLNGRYYFHGIDTQSPNLTDVFAPTMIDGTIFRNNPNRMFIGGNQHQRPALVIAGQYVYTGYASHCVKYNFTGAIIGFNKANGQIVEAYAMEGGPEPNTTPGGGVWMSGGGISYDGSSLFFATGNGYASQLAGTPVPGRQPPTALEEAAVNAFINTDGTLSVIDFFMPWEKVQLDGADKDLGTTPLELLPTNVFTCPNVRRMGVVTGKSGKTYVLNLDNLGGYQNGPNKLDAAVFVYQNENSVYAGAGVMPLGGGYIYINIIKYQTRVFKFACDGNGNPTFTVIAYTPEFNAAILGTGHGTTTSLNGQDGTGLLWVSDVEGLNLRIYNAIPQNGNLTLINSFNVPGVTKFTRPVFGDGRVYMGTTLGLFYGFGSPVNLPLNCSSPYLFGQQTLGTTSAPLTITCTALTQVTVLGLSIAGNPNFIIAANSSSKIANQTYAAGQTFSFAASFKPATVGPLSSDIIVNTTNAATGFSTNTPVTLRGTGYSANALLQIGPNTMSFNAIVNSTIGGINQTSLFNNLGNATLNIAKFLFSQQSETGPWVQPTISGGNLSNSSLVYSLGSFTFYNLPSSIPPNSAASVTINYNPTTLGNEALFLNTTSNGGSALLDLVAIGGAYPKALIEFERWDAPGQFTPLDNSSHFTFGNVTENLSRYLRLRVTNVGGPNAVGLSLTVSKPPFGVPGIVGAANNVDLAEGTLLAAGQNATAVLFCAVPKSQVNLPSYQGSANWTMNTGDPTLGKQYMEFDCNAVAEQVGPLYKNGSAQYGYIGCFRDNTPSRQLATNIYVDTANNTPQKCISACAAAGWIYAATQYQQECWCGNAIPLIQDMDRDCNYPCTGNVNEICGGNGFLGGRTEMSLYADLSRYVNVTSPPLSIPSSVNGYNYVGCFAEKNGRAVSAAGVGYTDTVGMTVESCQAYCFANGKYPYFSLEYSQECQCGTSINLAVGTITSDSSCSMTCKGNNSEYCGAGNFAQVYNLNGTKFNYTAPSSTAAATTAAPTATAAPVQVMNLTAYTNMGCYNETHDRRALLGASISSSSMTLEACATYCYGWNYFGVEFGSECYCANYIYANSYYQPPPNKCTMSCPGNVNETCGGPDALNVYYINATTFNPSATTAAGGGAQNPPAQSTATPTTVPFVGSYSYQGCYSEISGRALRASGLSNSSVSVEFCAQYCNQYQYFGVEYSQECYCGTTIQQGSTPGQTNCNMPCVAAPGEICGGSGSLSVYMSNGTFNASSQPTQPANNQAPAPAATATSTTVAMAGAFSYLGCYNEVPGRALQATSFANSSTTVEMCAQYCKGYSYFGVEYASECYCGNTIVTGSTNGSTACTMSCAGNPNETCGGPNALGMYMQSGNFTPATTAAAPATTPTSTTQTVKMAGAFTYQGCYNEVPGRALRGMSFANSSATVELCSSFCSGYSYFGVEYSSECYCGNTIISGSTNGSTACTMSCAGNSAETCGGPNALGMYMQSGNFTSATTQAAAPPPVATPTSNSMTVQSAGAFVYQGCYNEVPGRALQGSSLANNGMTVENCGTFCQGFQYFAVEYSRECYCANTIQTGSSNTSTSCTMTCAGNNGEICGGPNALSLYAQPAANISTSSASPSPSATQATFSNSTSGSASSSTISTSSTAATPSVFAPAVIGSYISMGCYSDNVGGRALSKLYANDTMSLDICAQQASANSASYFGVEYGRECWYGNTLSGNNGALSQSKCGFICTANNAEYCGAGNALQLYFNNATQPSTTSTPASAPSTTPGSASSTTIPFSNATTTTGGSAPSTVSTSTSTSSAPPTPTALASVGSYQYVGCYNETSGRTFSAASSSSSNMTPQMCATFCSNYAWFGVEYSSQCFCGPVVQPGAGLVNSGDCSMTCAGDNTLLCGAGNRLTTYFSNDTSKINSAPSSPASVGNYSFVNCTIDDPKMLSNRQASSSMTVENCAAIAEQGQYAYFGLEYGSECWYGSTLQNNLTSAPASDCSMTCSGNSTELCGNGNRLSLYNRNAGV